MSDAAKAKAIISGLPNMYRSMVKGNAALERGLVRCEKCKRQQGVDSAECLQRGWPECCGYTMTLVTA